MTRFGQSVLAWSNNNTTLLLMQNLYFPLKMFFLNTKVSYQSVCIIGIFGSLETQTGLSAGLYFRTLIQNCIFRFIMIQKCIFGFIIKQKGVL